MPRKNQGWITFQASPKERAILEAYCQRTQRSKTEVLRELVRQLESADTNSALQAVQSPRPPVPSEASLQPLPFQVSARNLLLGRITNLYRDGVNTEITLEVAPSIEITSVITSNSAQRLGLKVGKEAYAMVKSSNVMIATQSVLPQFADSLEG